MFKFKDKTSKEMNVIVEESINLLGKAAQRLQVIDIEGRDGSQVVPLGYSDFTNSLSLTLMKVDRLDEILDWLDGEGELEYKGKVTCVSFFASIDPSRVSSKIGITVDFTRAPFWYKKDDEYITVTNEVINEGNMEVFPFIMLTKKTDNQVEISINDVRFKYNFNNTDHVIIDCVNKNATENGLLRNRNLEIDFKFPLLRPGKNIIMLHSGDAEIKIKRKDCWK